MNIAVADLARFSVVNSVAVAQIQAIGSAKTPDRVLHEPRKCRREFWVKRARVNAVCDGSYDLGAAAAGITGRAIGVRDTAVFQNAGAMQEIVDQRVYCDHGFTGLEPYRPLAACPDQQAGQRHR